MGSAFRRCCAVSLAFAGLLLGNLAVAQVLDIPEIVVTPNYLPTPTGRVGSTVSVISAEQIARASPVSMTQLFQSIPGVTVIESGGPGGSTEVRLRGAETGHTLVLIDGVRANDFATARDDFDFALLSPNDIERIEILRGPQSAVYGSDAIGGVINIITRKPAAGMSASAKVEGGSYGTHTERLSGGMSAGDFAVRFSGSYLSSEGFSRRGDPDANEADGTEKWAGSASLVYAPAGGPKVEAGVNAFDQFSEYDASGLSGANAPNTVDRTSISGYGRISMPAFDGRFEQSLTGFFLDTSRDNREPGGTLPVSLYDATAVGAEYQGVIDLASFGSLLLGSRLEHEAASNVAETTGAAFPGYESDRTFYAFYALHQATLLDNLHLTFGGRYDGEIDGEGFLTGRATAAYEIPETGTTLRASVGTGAKRPTAYQIGNNLFADVLFPGQVDTDLKPEKSIGVDAGVEQSLFGGVLDVSATAFYNRFDDLLVFEFLDAVNGAYENVDSAETAGVEVAAEADILPGLMRGGVSYTYLYSRNLETGRALPRRPEHSAAFDLTLIGSDRFEMTLSGILVGERFNTSSATTPLPGYGRLDLSAKYVLVPGTELLARIENLTDNEYQDPSGFNAPGLSGYVGLSWGY